MNHADRENKLDIRKHFLYVARLSLAMGGFGLILTGIVSAGIPFRHFLNMDEGQYHTRVDQVSASLDKYRAALKMK